MHSCCLSGELVLPFVPVKLPCNLLHLVMAAAGYEAVRADTAHASRKLLRRTEQVSQASAINFTTMLR